VLEAGTPTPELNKRQFDARPDRIDFRNQYFRARLVSLEPEHPQPSLVERYLEKYCRDAMILDQGEEGACTGFRPRRMRQLSALGALAARRGKRSAAGPRVSTRMLYHMARLYDEWPGEDYDGSSCRGAMKGWHHHGVCSESLWPYRERFTEPKEGSQHDATLRPLRAYCRINKDSIVDMQAAMGTLKTRTMSSTVGGEATSPPGARSGPAAPSRASTTRPGSRTAGGRSRSRMAALTTTSRWSATASRSSEAPAGLSGREAAGLLTGSLRRAQYPHNRHGLSDD
jgi:hypothetical protein